MKRMSLVLAGLLVPALLQAQLADPSTRALGMGGAYTSLARGYEAVAWNPAMLAAVGRPSFTIDLPHLNLEFGSNAYGLSDVQKYANTYLTSADKQTLLGKIKDSTLTLRSLVGVAPFGLSIGPFGLLVSSAGQMSLGVGKDAVQLALYGNAPGSETFTARGSNGNAWAATTIAGSFALPIPSPLGHLAVGATYKYVIGNFLGSAADLGTQVAFNPLFSATEAGEAIYTNYDSNCGTFSPFKTGMCGGQAGKGYGVDLGGTLQLAGRGITLSAVLVNVVGKMTWDQSRLYYNRTVNHSTQTAAGNVVEDTSRVTLKDQQQIGADTSAQKLQSALLAKADFSRLARVGLALRSGPLTLAGDVQIRLKEGLDQQPSQLLSVGAEYRLLGLLAFRGGASSDFAGATAFGGGLGFQLLGINLDVSGQDLVGSTRPGVRVGVGLGLIW